jgi:hypothetical protein
MSDRSNTNSGAPLQKRFLSKRQAQRCEDACEPICKCRCGGAFHGAKRGSIAGLSESDPHFVPTAEWKKAKAAAERSARIKARLKVLYGI